MTMVEVVGSGQATTLYLGDCLEVLPTLPENSVDAVVTDPPFGLEFMSVAWDSFAVPKGAPRTPNTWGDYGSKEHPRDATSVARITRNKAQAFQEFSEQWAREVLRVLKPGGYAIIWGGERTYHRMACAVEDSGFVVRFMLVHIQSQGFPKNLDISRQFDQGAITDDTLRRFTDALHSARIAKGLSRAAVSQAICGTPSGACWNWEHGIRVPTSEHWHELSALLDLPPELELLRVAAERVVVGKGSAGFGKRRPALDGGYKPDYDVTMPATDLARQWDGWGTQLKPSASPILLAQKPLSEGNIAANIVRWGVGGLNIDATRVKPQSRPLGGDACTLSSPPDAFVCRDDISLLSVQGTLRRIVSVLRACSTSDTGLWRDVGDHDGKLPRDAEYGGNLLRRLWPNDLWCDLDWSAAQGSLADCPSCRRFGDEQLRCVQAAVQESSASLADALEDICRVLPEWTRSPDCRCIGRPSSCDVLVRTSALVTLLYNPTLYSAPLTTYSRSGRWPSNLILQHSPGCRQEGTTREPGRGSGAGTGSLANGQTLAGGRATKRTPFAGYADADGMETVPNWVCVEECPVRLLDEQAGPQRSGGAPRRRFSPITSGIYGAFRGQECPGGIGASSGSVSRFFMQFASDDEDDGPVPFLYCAKAGTSEREAGLEDFPALPTTYRPNDPAESTLQGRLHGSRARRNIHPTVKPLALTRYLVRLITPPGGTVLDLFLGSGTTAIAAELEGFSCIGIEQSPEYLDVARRRIAYWSGRSSETVESADGVANDAEEVEPRIVQDAERTINYVQTRLFGPEET